MKIDFNYEMVVYAVAKCIGFLALIVCYYSNNLARSISQTHILIVTFDKHPVQLNAALHDEFFLFCFV